MCYTVPDFIKFTYYDGSYTLIRSTVLLSSTLYCNHSNVRITFTFVCDSIVLGVILCSTFEVQCTLLRMYTVVNESTVIVCKLNNVWYCIMVCDV